MSSTFTTNNIRYTSTLSRPSTTKGSILSHDGSETFELTAPTVNGQNLVSDSSESNGIVWSSGIQGSSFGLYTPNSASYK